MKSLKELLAEVAQPKPEEEKRFKDLHDVETIDYVIPQEHVFSGEIERQPRLADAGGSEKYDTAYVGKEPAKPIKEETKVDARRREFKEKLKALLYKKEQEVTKKLADKEVEESAEEEIPMMEKQLSFISFAADEISEYVKNSGDPEEWYQNKLAEAHASIKSLYAYAQGELKSIGEEVEEDESLDELFEAAMSEDSKSPSRLEKFESEIDEGDKEEYTKFFKATLKKFGVSSPAELEGEKEKEFYNYIEKNWKADNEETDIEEYGSSTPMRDKFGPVNPKLKDKKQKKESIVSGVLSKRNK